MAERPSLRVCRSFWRQLAAVTVFAALAGARAGGLRAATVASCVFCAFGSAALLHELGHLAMARAFGVRVHGLHLTGLLHAQLRRGTAPTWRQQVCVTMAGPLTSLGVLVAGVSLPVLTLLHVWHASGPLSLAGWVLAAANTPVLVGGLLPDPASDLCRARAAVRGRPHRAEQGEPADGHPLGGARPVQRGGPAAASPQR